MVGPDMYVLDFVTPLLVRLVSAIVKIKSYIQLNYYFHVTLYKLTYLHAIVRSQGNIKHVTSFFHQRLFSIEKYIVYIIFLS